MSTPGVSFEKNAKKSLLGVSLLIKRMEFIGSTLDLHGRLEMVQAVQMDSIIQPFEGIDSMTRPGKVLVSKESMQLRHWKINLTSRAGDGSRISCV